MAASIKPPLPKLLSSSESEKLRIREVKKEKRKSKLTNAAASNAQPIPPRRPWITSTTISYLTAIALAQHLTPPSLSLPEEIQHELQEEWEHIVHDSFERFRKEMQCTECGDTMEWCGDEGVKWFLKGLREEMDAWCAWEVDERCVERWDGGFEKMVPLLMGRKMNGCWALEQENMEQDKNCDVNDVHLVWDDGGGVVSLEAQHEAEVEECKIEGLEALRLMGGEGFTADGFIRYRSPLWGSISRTSQNLSGEFKDDAGSQQIFAEDNNTISHERSEESQLLLPSNRLQVQGPTTFQDDHPGQFTIDIFDVSGEDGSSTNDSDALIGVDPPGDDDLRRGVLENFEEAVGSDNDVDANLVFEEDERFPTDGMEMEESSEEAIETDSLNSKVSETGCDLETVEDPEMAIRNDNLDNGKLSEQKEEVYFNGLDFEDHARFPLGDAMDIVRSHMSSSETGEDDEDDIDFETFLHGETDDEGNDSGDTYEDVPNRRPQEGEDEEQECDFEQNLDVEIYDRVGDSGTPTDGDADDERSDETPDNSDSESDAKIREVTGLTDSGTEEDWSVGPSISDVHRDVLIQNSDQISAPLKLQKDIENLDEGYSEYDVNVQHRFSTGYGAQFQGVREYQNDESEESEEE